MARANDHGVGLVSELNPVLQGVDLIGMQVGAVVVLAISRSTLHVSADHLG